MSLIRTLKLYADLLFYMTFAGAVISTQTEAARYGGLLSILPFLALSAVLLGYFAERKRLKWLAVMPLISALFMTAFNYGIFNFILLLPACVYIIYYAKVYPHNVGNLDYRRIFVLYVCIALLFFFISALLLGVYEVVLINNAVLAPYIIMFSMSSMLLMRIVRHDSQVLSQARFKVMNIINVVSVVFVGVVLGSVQLRQFMAAFAVFLYSAILIPFLSTIISAGIYAASYVGALIGLLNPDWETFDEVNLAGYGEYVDEMLGLPPGDPIGATDSGINVETIADIVLLVMLALVLLLLLRSAIKLLVKRGWVAKNGSFERVERMPLKGDELRSSRRVSRANNQIRQIYRQFLKLCKVKGIILKPHHTTEDIAKIFKITYGEGKSVFALREIYINSRYGEKTPKEADAKKCLEIYNKLKKMG